MAVSIIVGLIIACVALGFNLISLAIPYWLKDSVSHSGLWKRCYELLGGETICRDFDSVADWLDAVRAFMVIGFLLFVLAVVCAFLFCTVMKTRSMIGLMAPLACLAASISTCVAFVIYGAKLSDFSEYLHAGFGLAVLSAIVGFVGFVLLFVARKNVVN